MSQHFRQCLLLRRSLSHLQRPRKRMRHSRAHLRLWLPRHCNNHKFHRSRDLDWVTEKPMVDGVYHGVKKDIGVKSSRLVVVSQGPSKCVTSCHHATVETRY